jgi:GT2 family glycosyltransferase
MSIELSILIPTFARPAKIGACVASLARQSLPHSSYEVLVGLDGPDPASVEAITRVWDGPDENLIIDVAPRSGPSAVRNRLLGQARGTSVLFLNDDVVPSSTLAEVHRREQVEADRRGRPALIVGSAPRKRFANERLFDRLVRETSMVFSYDAMDTPASLAQPMKDWGFRRAWSHNLSGPLDLFRSSGGFTVFPQPCYRYEGIELAFRVGRQYQAPVLYRPAARVEHDHRLDPAEYLRREYTLGHVALTFARLRPECSAALLGRDITSREEAEYCRMFVERERPLARRLRRSFEQAALAAPDSVDGEAGPMLRRMFYEQHLPLKRWVWRAGLLDALEQRAMQPGCDASSWDARLAA